MCRSARMGVVGFFFATSGLAGCGDPAVDRLEVGSQAIVYDAKRGDVAFLCRERDSFEALAVGTRVRVVADADADADPGESRDVRINVMEGPLSGLVTTLGRDHLRPIR